MESNKSKTTILATKIILTKTSYGAAQKLADELSEKLHADIEGREVSSLEQLSLVLRETKPDAIFIAAKDVAKGQNIHADYLLESLKQ